MSQPDEKLSSVSDLIKRFKVSDSTVRRWVRSGQIDVVICGRQLRFEEREIRRFMDMRRRAKVRRDK